MAPDQSKTKPVSPSGVTTPSKSAPEHKPAQNGAKKDEVRTLLGFADFIVFGRFLRDDIKPEDVRIDESAYLSKHSRLVSLIKRQNYIIIALVLSIIILEPYLHPINHYFAKKPSTDGQTKPITGMMQPNTTDDAVLAWVEASITEIMTFGFGDIDRRILAQRQRFTEDGWQSFLESIRSQNMRETFKLRQLVLTTAPSNAPVIISKGLDEDKDYVWTIQLPIVMTFTTNNNVRSGQKSIVTVTVARVPTKKNVRGIGIKKWRMT